MDFGNFDELNKDERMKAVANFIKEVGDVQLGLNYDGYEEVTFLDVLKAYEIMLLKGSKGDEK